VELLSKNALLVILDVPNVLELEVESVLPALHNSISMVLASLVEMASIYPMVKPLLPTAQLAMLDVPSVLELELTSVPPARSTTISIVLAKLALILSNISPPLSRNLPLAAVLNVPLNVLNAILMEPAKHVKLVVM